MGFLRKLFGLEVEDVPEYSCKGYDSLDYGKTPQSSTKTLKIRFSLEAEAIDKLIDHLKKVKRELEEFEIPDASAIPVTSQEVVKKAQHAKDLAWLRDRAISIDKETKYLLNGVKYAAEQGFYGASRGYGNVCFGKIDEFFYQGDVNGLSKDYYLYALTTMYFFHIVIQLQKSGYKFKFDQCRHDVFILTDTNVPDELAVYKEDLERYKQALTFEQVFPGVKLSVKKLYDEFPELFTCQMKQEFGV